MNLGRSNLILPFGLHTCTQTPTHISSLTYLHPSTSRDAFSTDTLAAPVHNKLIRTRHSVRQSKSIIIIITTAAPCAPRSANLRCTSK